MGRGVTINKYPIIFLDLAEEIDTMEDDDDHIIVTCKSDEAATGFRLDFYAFREAMRRDKSIELYRKVDRVELSLRGKQVIITPKDKTENAKAVEASLVEWRAYKARKAAAKAAQAELDAQQGCSE